MKANWDAPLVFVVSLVMGTGEVQGSPATPSEQFDALLQVYGPASAAIRDATTDAERRIAVERLGTNPQRFLALAERHPGDPVALKAPRQAVQAASSTDSATQIAWETNSSDFPPGCNDSSAAKAVALLTRGHLLSDEIGPVCDRLRYSYRLESAEFLRFA